MSSRSASHEDKVKNAYAALQAMQEEEEAAARAGADETAHPEPGELPSEQTAQQAARQTAQTTEQPVEDKAEKGAAEPPAAEEGEPAPSPAKRMRTARAKGSKKPSQATAAANTESPSRNKVRFTVAMDPDLIELMSLARPAFPKKNHQIFFAAAGRHASAAGVLPDTPLAKTVLDDKYDDVVLEAAHRIPYSAYVTSNGYAALAADADAAGLDHSGFMRRVLRRYLAVEHAFVPRDKAHLLEQPSEPCDAIMEELSVQMGKGRPAAVLPTAGNLMWRAVELPEGTPLRALTDQALLTMPGCTSATQALLTVL